MIIFVFIQLVVYCSAQTSQCKATSVLYSYKLGSFTWWAGKLPYLALDVCNLGVTNGSFISQKFECDSQGNLYENRWIGSGCLGDPYYEEMLDDGFEPSLIGPSGYLPMVDLDYTRNLNESECSGTKDCDYAILRVYKDCGDDYLEQAWVMNECVSSRDEKWSCKFVCGTHLPNATFMGSAIDLKCYKGQNCDIHSEYTSINIVWDILPCRRDRINNISYRYEVECDAYIAPFTTTATMTSSTNTTNINKQTTTTTTIFNDTSNHFGEQYYNSKESKQSDMWMIIAVVFIILFIIVVVGVVFSIWIQRRNIKKRGYTKTGVEEQV